MKSFGTPFSKSLGLKYPLFVAPMFLISNADMLVAAAEAGIMAAMPHLNARTHEAFVETLADVRRRTGGPIGVNLLVNFPGAADRLEADLEACIEFGVSVIVTSLGLSEPVIRRAHECGVKVIHDVVSLKHAKKADAVGVDGIVAVSAGAGGHGGHISPMVFGPYIKENVKAAMILAEGIATGRQVAAALALGSSLAYMGTCFIASSESGVNPEYMDMLLRAGPEDVVFTPEVCGVPADFLAESFAKWKAAKAEGKELPKAWKDVWGAGHGVGLIDEVKPIAEIVEDIVKEYHDAVAALAR